MEKQPLKEEGLQVLLQHLYALPDAELFVKAAAIAADFRAWIAAHFILNELQVSYLNALDNLFVANAASDSRDFVQQRLPIELLKDAEPEPAEGEDKPRGKIIEVAKRTTNSSTAKGMETYRSLRFKISYPLLS